MADVYIYEDTYRCEDCESGNPTHNSFHLPHTTFSAAFNKPDPDFDHETFTSHVLVEEWEIEELRGMYESSPEMGEHGVYDLSWTQLAISRCNELER